MKPPAGRAPREGGRGGRGARARSLGPPAAAGWAGGITRCRPARPGARAQRPGSAGKGGAEAGPRRVPRGGAGHGGCGREGDARYPGLGGEERAGRGQRASVPQPGVDAGRRGVPPPGEELLGVRDSPGWAVPAGARGVLGSGHPSSMGWTGTWGPKCPAGSNGRLPDPLSGLYLTRANQPSFAFQHCINRLCGEGL